ncbi:GAF domain-containing protein [Kitasatospora sp. MAP5-34]|uniref:GAF domain-containing sensor histidine kinase n=1 Tax=Kitasatospora sp. MAP5-34 TaxID=3035102 RepID=UPI002474DDA1|nr:GAF domain-containing protein [Kitasatospora sp. MAP5-34]MDH6575354.1 signal transduction histidine kinase [Kitasatospora sp. MAP5-34]
MSDNESIRDGAPPAGLALALAACGATLLCALGWSGLALTHLGDKNLSSSYFYDGVNVALYLTFSLSGLFILVNRRATGLGALLLATGLLETLRMFVVLGAGLAGAGPVAADFVVVLPIASLAAYYFLIFAFPLWLPDGRLPTGRWRVVTVLLGLWSLVLAFYWEARARNWDGVANPLRHGVWRDFGRDLGSVLDPAAWNAFTATVGFTLVVAAVRWWRSPGRTPRLVEVVVPYLVWMLLIIVPEYADLTWSGLGYAQILIGQGAWLLGLAVAFRRDRSLSLDRSTRFYLSAYTFCTFVFIAVLGAVYLTHSLLGVHARTGGGEWWMLFVVAVLGALLRPATRGVLHAVDRAYYGERAQPYRVVRELAERMSHAVSPAGVPPLLCATAVQALGLPGAVVRVHTRSGPRELAALGEHELPGETFPLTYEGAVIGDLAVPPRSGQRTLDRQDREVLRMLAGQASPAIASLRLYEELQASRKQIVLAREEERRRLRHDLHDGLGPALSGLRLQVDAARSGIAEDCEAARSLATASRGIGQAITELRRITDGLAPAALGSDGLAVALRRLADGFGGRALQVTLDLDPDPLPRLPAAVEVAVYRISGEALNNVVRHSGATSVRLALRVGSDEITVEAHDDGAGFPAHANGAGVGLRSMAERAEELGGRFSAANDARGAVVRAVFPRAGAAEQAG